MSVSPFFLFVVVVVFDILLLIFVVIVSRLNEESFCVSANYDIINRAWITKLFVSVFSVFFRSVFFICLFVCFLVISCYSELPQFRFEFLCIIDRARIKKSCSDTYLALCSRTINAKQLYLFRTFLNTRQNYLDAW